MSLLIGYDDTYYYYIDPLWTQLTKGVIPSIIPNHKQIIRIKNKKNVVITHQAKCVYSFNHNRKWNLETKRCCLEIFLIIIKF